MCAIQRINLALLKKFEAESSTSGYTFIHNIYGTLKTYLQHIVLFIQTPINIKGYRMNLFFQYFFFEIKTFFLPPYGSNSFWLSQMVYLCLAYIKMCTSPTRLPDRMRRYSQKTDYKKGEKQKLDSDCRMSLLDSLFSRKRTSVS